MSSFLRYGLVGVGNTLLGYAIIFGAMALLNVSPELANALGYGLCLTLSFLLNKRWSFRSEGKMSGEFIRFLLAFLIAYACNLIVLLLLVDYLHVNPYVAQIAAGIVYVVTTFFLLKWFVFRKARPTSVSA